MALQGGDREFGHGDQVTVVYDDTTDAEAGDAVKVTGRSSEGDHATVDLVASATDGLADGIIADAATQGDHIQVVMHGIVWARVASGDNVSAGDTVGESTTAGELSSSGSEYTVLEGEATDAEGGAAIALIRFEN